MYAGRLSGHGAKTVTTAFEYEFHRVFLLLAGPFRR